MKLHFWINLMLVLVTTSFAPEFHSTIAGKVNSTGNSCQPKTLETLNLSSDAGEFLYEPHEGEVSIEAEYIRSVRLPLGSQTRRISPNGLYIAGEDVKDDDLNIQTVAVLDHSEEMIYSGAGSRANIIDIRWLGNDRLLSFVQLPSGSAEVAYFVIDPFNREYTYVEPPRTPPFYYETPNRAVPIGGYDFTYDGRYLFWDSAPMYDFELDQPLKLQNLQGGVPALNSHRLIGVDHVTYESEGIYPVYIYDFDNDMLTSVTTFTPEAPISIYDNSWSPDETMWTYILYYGEDIAFRRVEILQLESGEIRSTCLGLFFETDVAPFSGTHYASSFLPVDFAWSRDSRYLALQAVLEGHDMEESLGVYIYDTQTEDIYEVYRGRANIVGWMANP